MVTPQLVTLRHQVEAKRALWLLQKIKLVVFIAMQIITPKFGGIAVVTLRTSANAHFQRAVGIIADVFIMTFVMTFVIHPVIELPHTCSRPACSISCRVRASAQAQRQLIRDL